MTPRQNGHQLAATAVRRPADDGEEDELRRRGQARELAEFMRPALPRLVEQIVREVWRAVPVYARPGEGRYTHVTRQGVDCAVKLFVDLVEDPATARDKLHETCRRLGAGEAREGRTLDDLHAAYRVGTRVAWQGIMRLGQRHHLSSMAMGRLGEMLFGYADELAKMSFQGYREAQAEMEGAREGLRRRLLQLVLERPAVPVEVITDSAQAVGWAPPDTVAAVSVEPHAHVSRTPVTSWGTDVLSNLELPQPHLLLPAPIDQDRLHRIASDLGVRIVVGPPTPLDKAANSLRWARAAERLVARGVLPAARITWCAEHLTTLWLLSDEDLVDQLARHQFGPLAGFSEATQLRLAETLLSWLGHGGKIPKIAAELVVHPQTVRYRLRQLEQVFGDRLHDPKARFTMEMVLRAMALRHESRNGAAGPG
ncbi:helix-turn-helix domain-containing protein [Amycolatopsis sp. NPDC051128]|uniref:PucR family transcriptional regulator n=1 Tax=Amycolatopsis sp. NPDC051128 TaxID=3155412 RepID=UPI0034370671